MESRKRAPDSADLQLLKRTSRRTRRGRRFRGPGAL